MLVLVGAQNLLLDLWAGFYYPFISLLPETQLT